MEFTYINQPDFDRERDGAVSKILDRWDEPLPPMGHYTKWPDLRKAYNEGFKACLRLIQKEYWNPDISDAVFDGMAEEVDKIC